MNRIGRFISIFSVMILPAMIADARPLSEMSADEIRELLAMRPEKENAEEQAESVVLPVQVTAKDMITKIYGVLSPRISKQKCISDSERIFKLTPQEDEGALWLETADGYGVDYSGMRPEVSAMARYDKESLSDFGFFFLFPYAVAGKDASNQAQTAFCGSLLQEMYDMGMNIGKNEVAEDSLFEAVGDYAGNLVDVRLIEDDSSLDGGRYVLILSVEPGAYTSADDSLALNK